MSGAAAPDDQREAPPLVASATTSPAEPPPPAADGAVVAVARRALARAGLALLGLGALVALAAPATLRAPGAGGRSVALLGASAVLLAAVVGLVEAVALGLARGLRLGHAPPSQARLLAATGVVLGASLLGLLAALVQAVRAWSVILGRDPGAADAAALAYGATLGPAHALGALPAAVMLTLLALRPLAAQAAPRVRRRTGLLLVALLVASWAAASWSPHGSLSRLVLLSTLVGGVTADLLLFRLERRRALADLPPSASRAAWARSLRVAVALLLLWGLAAFQLHDAIAARLGEGPTWLLLALVPVVAWAAWVKRRTLAALPPRLALAPCDPASLGWVDRERLAALEAALRARGFGPPLDLRTGVGDETAGQLVRFHARPDGLTVAVSHLPQVSPALGDRLFVSASVRFPGGARAVATDVPMNGLTWVRLDRSTTWEAWPGASLDELLAIVEADRDALRARLGAEPVQFDAAAAAAEADVQWSQLRERVRGAWAVLLLLHLIRLQAPRRVRWAGLVPA